MKKITKSGSSHLTKQVVPRPTFDQAKLLPKLDPEMYPHFDLMWVDGNWDVFLDVPDVDENGNAIMGSILPVLTEFKQLPGVNGASLDYRFHSSAMVFQSSMAEDKGGWVFINEETVKGLAGYEEGIYDHVKVMARTREGQQATACLPKYHTPIALKQELIVDWPEYKRLCEFLIDNQVISMPNEQELKHKKSQYEDWISRRKDDTIAKLMKEKVKIINRYLGVSEDVGSAAIKLSPKTKGTK